MVLQLLYFGSFFILLLVELSIYCASVEKNCNLYDH